MAANTLARFLFFGTEIVLAIGIFITQAPLLEGPVLLLALLIALGIAAELNPVQIYGHSAISLGFVTTIAIITLFGAPGVVIAAPFAAAACTIAVKSVDFRLVHNMAMFIIVHTAAAAVFALWAGVRPDGFSIALLPATLAATATAFILTASILGLVLKLVTNQPFRGTWENHAWLAPHYMALGVLGLAFALSYVGLGVFGLVAFLTPVATLRLALKQYVNKTEVQVRQLEDQNVALTQANIEVRHMGDQLSESYDGTLKALVNALDARDQETMGHSLRVQRYMMDIAREMGVVEGTKDWQDMQRGSLLHDVGKIGVSDNILLKAGKLTEDEWKMMRLHPQIGYDMLHQVKFLEGAAEIILCHHERWDGQGYPNGLREHEIPLGARIFPIVDTFDAMTSDRPYRKALPTLVALNEILKNSGSQFDPRVVEAFMDIYEQWVREREEMHAERPLKAA